MNLVIFACFALLSILLLTMLESKLGQNVVYLFGIGSIINGSIFHVYANPTSSFNLQFGIDFVLAPLFFWCLFLMFKKGGKKGATTMLLVSLFSLMFSGLVQFLANILTYGYVKVFASQLFGFVISAASFAQAGFVLIASLKKVIPKLKATSAFAALFFASALNFLTFYFTHLVFYNQANWHAFASFFAFCFVLNLVFVLAHKVYSSNKM